MDGFSVVVLMIVRCVTGRCNKGVAKTMPTESPDPRSTVVLLDARERPPVAVPLMPEFAVVSTLVLVAAPIVLVGAAALAALLRRSYRSEGGVDRERLEPSVTESS